MTKPARDLPPPDPALERCPRCGATDPAMTLLTSMTRYFTCRACACRWQVTIEPDRDPGSPGRDA